MRRVFADTLYWVALAHPGDQWHTAAREAEKLIGNAQVVTTDEVLTEVLNSLSGHGHHVRTQVAQMVRAIQAAQHISVIEQSRSSFLAGLQLFEQRADKGYSLTDCISMATCRTLAISDVLTNDHHFEQDGFTLLIR